MEEELEDQKRFITILDFVRAKVGDKECYDVPDHHFAGVQIIGGCAGCHATIASYNAYPSKSGYWCCEDCIGDDGFSTVAEFEAEA